MGPGFQFMAMTLFPGLQYGSCNMAISAPGIMPKSIQEKEKGKTK